MEIELLIYKNYSQTVIWFLKSTGLWPKANRILKKMLFMVSLFSSFVAMMSVSSFSFQNVGNVMVLTRGMSLAVGFSTVFSKAALFLLHQDDLIYLNNTLTKTFTLDLKDSKNHSYLLNNVRTFNRFMYTQAIALGCAVSMYIIGPLLSLHRHGKYIRAFPAIYPFAYEPGGLVHWVLYVVEASSAASMWTVTVAVDCVFGVYALQVCGELRLLGQKFRDLKAADNYQEKLRDCIQRHHLIINAKNKLESLYGFIAIWLAISGALVVCSIIFQVTELLKVDNGYLRAIHLSVYLTPKAVQIFSYSWCGNLIADEVCIHCVLCIDAFEEKSVNSRKSSEPSQFKNRFQEPVNLEIDFKSYHQNLLKK